MQHPHPHPHAAMMAGGGGRGGGEAWANEFYGPGERRVMIGPHPAEMEAAWGRGGGGGGGGYGNVHGPLPPPMMQQGGAFAEPLQGVGGAMAGPGPLVRDQARITIRGGGGGGAGVRALSKA